MIDRFKWLIVLALLFLLSHQALAADFTNPYNHAKKGALERLKVCGERCSGTNYVMYLLHKNFPTLAPTGLREFGHKHYLWWLGTEISQKKLQKLGYTLDDITLSNAANCLFVVVVRDPYDWLRSFYLKPYDVHKSVCKKDFHHFVTSRWKLTSRYPEDSGKYNIIDNRNPQTQKPFENVLQLRKAKIQNYLQLGARVDNFLFVRYEDVRDNPQGFVDFVATYFSMTKTDTFDPVNIVFDTSIPPNLPQPECTAPFVQKTYFPIQTPTLEFINRKMDWKLETLIGYHRKDKI